MKTIIASLLLFGIAVFGHVRAETIELCTAIDGSSSINNTEFKLQIDGLAKAIADPAVIPRNGTITISVVQFSGAARLEVPPTRITDVNTAGYIASKVAAISQIGSGTYIETGIDLCKQQFNFSADKQIIDISTDGMSSGDPDAAADRAVAAGVDAINSLGIGDGINELQLHAMVRPQPASNNPQEEGFVLLVDNFEKYIFAIRNKVAGEAGSAPPPPLPEPPEYCGGEQVVVVLPDAKTGEEQYVWLTLPNGVELSLNGPNSLVYSGGNRLVWPGGNTAIDMNLPGGIPQGEYIVNLLTLQNGLDPLSSAYQDKIKDFSIIVASDLNADAFVTYEFGCAGRGTIASEFMPVSVDAGNSRFTGKVYFYDYDGAGPRYVSIAGSYDNSLQLNVTAQGYSAPDQFSGYELFRTDTFSGRFDNTGLLSAQPDVEFQPNSNGCDIYVNMKRLAAPDPAETCYAR